MKKAQLDKLEKLARRQARINAEFQALSEETQYFDYDGNGIIAAGRVSEAASILNALFSQQSTGPEQADAHSCRANAEYTDSGPAGAGTYCTVCGALVRSYECD